MKGSPLTGHRWNVLGAKRTSRKGSQRLPPGQDPAQDRGVCFPDLITFEHILGKRKPLKHSLHLRLPWPGNSRDQKQYSNTDRPPPCRGWDRQLSPENVSKVGHRDYITVMCQMEIEFQVIKRKAKYIYIHTHTKKKPSPRVQRWLHEEFGYLMVIYHRNLSSPRRRQWLLWSYWGVIAQHLWLFTWFQVYL